MISPPRLAALRPPADLLAWLSSQDPAGTIDCPRGDWSIYLAVAGGIDMRAIVRATCGTLRDTLDGYETEPTVSRVLDVAVQWSSDQDQRDRPALVDQLDDALEAFPSGTDIPGSVSATMRVLGALHSVLSAIDALDAVTGHPDLELAGLANATGTLADAMFSAAAAPIEGDQVSIAYDDDADTLDPERFATTMRTLAILFRAELQSK